MIAAADDRKQEILNIIVDLARSKLLCQNKIDVGYSDLKEKSGATAVVDLRLMFDYETRREAARSRCERQSTGRSRSVERPPS